MHSACYLILHTGFLIYTLSFPRQGVCAESSRIKSGTSTEVILIKAFRLSRFFLLPYREEGPQISR